MPRQPRLDVVAKADRVLHEAPAQHLALVGYVHPQKLLVVLLDAAPKGMDGAVVCQNGATIHPHGASGLECALEKARKRSLLDASAGAASSSIFIEGGGVGCWALVVLLGGVLVTAAGMPPLIRVTFKASGLIVGLFVLIRRRHRRRG